MQAVNKENIKNGFRKAGIHPFTMDNVDLMSVEGGEHRETAFWPEEDVVIDNQVCRGTMTEKPLIVQTHMQTDHSGDIEELEFIHAQSLRTYTAQR